MSLMRVVVFLEIACAFLGLPSLGLSDERLQPPMGPPGDGPVQVVVNSQKSLSDAVGDGFTDGAWEYPIKLLPSEFPGLIHVGGPGDTGTFGKGTWRKPVVLTDKASGVQLAVNCYRMRDEKGSAAAPTTPSVSGTPFAPLWEPDYRYKNVEFHGLRAATASEANRETFVFRDGDLLFKFDAACGNAETRREAITTAAETTWKFRRNP